MKDLRERLARWKGVGYGTCFFILALIAASLSYSFREVSALENAVADMGLMLQLLGLSTLAHVLGAVQMYFGHDPWWEKWRAGLFFFANKLENVFHSHAESTLQTDGADAQVKLQSASLDVYRDYDRIEDRVSQLETKHRELKEKMYKLQRTHDEDISEIRETISSLRDEVCCVSEKMEGAHLTDLKLEGAGLLCLIVGLPLTVRPNWILPFIRLLADVCAYVRNLV